MKKILGFLILFTAFGITMNSVFACDCANCDCTKKECTCASEQCDCGCQSGEDCKCGCCQNCSEKKCKCCDKHFLKIFKKKCKCER